MSGSCVCLKTLGNSLASMGNRLNSGGQPRKGLSMEPGRTPAAEDSGTKNKRI